MLEELLDVQGRINNKQSEVNSDLIKVCGKHDENLKVLNGAVLDLVGEIERLQKVTEELTRRVKELES